MFEFNLLRNEKIVIISNEALLKKQRDVERVSVIITNQRFLILSLPKDVEAFRFGRMIDSFKMSRKEIVFETVLDNIEKVIIEREFDKYILKDANYFYLQDDVIRKYLSDNIL